MASMQGDEVWTDTSIPAAYRPFLYCSVSEGSCAAFKPVLAEWPFQMVRTCQQGEEKKTGNHWPSSLS